VFHTEQWVRAFSMVTDFLRLVEQTQKMVVTIDGKIDRLLAQEQQEKQK
jgi:hypothetical protein